MKKVHSPERSVQWDKVYIYACALSERQDGCKVFSQVVDEVLMSLTKIRNLRRQQGPGEIQ
jgi:hypothetical protein